MSKSNRNAPKRAGGSESTYTFYDFDQIDQAAHDAEAGHVIKPVLRMG